MMRAAAPAVALLIALGGCSDRPGPTTVRLWAMGHEGDVVAPLIAGFEREHPEIRVEIQALPWTSAHEKLLTAFVGEATPDVAQLGNTWLPELAALDALTPLDARIATSPVVRPPDYFPGIWATNQIASPGSAGARSTPGGSAESIAGVVYGVPWYVDTRLLFYRPDLLAAAGYREPPVSWPAWLDAMRAIKRQVGASRFAVLLPIDEFEQLLSFALQEDDPLLRDGGRFGNFRSAGFKRALAFYLGMFIEQLAPVTTQIQVPNPWDELARGYFAFFLHGPWSIDEFKHRLPASQQALWATAALPGPHGPGAAIAGGASLVIFRRSAHPDQAWQLIEYLSRPDIQRAFQELTGNLPPRRASWDAPFARDPHVEPFRDQLERVKRTPPVPEWERIATEMRVVSERAVRRVSPATTPGELAAIVDTATRELDARADEMLEKRRWILDQGRQAAP